MVSNFKFLNKKISKTKANQFEMAVADNVFHEEAATIKNDKVILQSDIVRLPIKIRFAWKNTDQSILFN